MYHCETSLLLPSFHGLDFASRWEVDFLSIRRSVNSSLEKGELEDDD